MAVYFFSEKVIQISELPMEAMGHHQTSEWLKKNRKYADSNVVLSFIRQSVKNGQMVVNLQASEGKMTIRNLWKEAAWKKYSELRCEAAMQRLQNGESFGGEFGDDVLCYTYVKVGEEEKKKLINTYFIDFFAD